MRTHNTKPSVQFVLRMKASDYSLTTIEPGATKRFDLRGTSRHDQKVAGQIISGALRLRTERRHHKRIAAYYAALDREEPREQKPRLFLSTRSTGTDRRPFRSRKNRRQAHAA